MSLFDLTGKAAIVTGSSRGLPTALATSESDGGLGVKMVFERHPHRVIEGVTPKALPAPDGDKDQ